MSSWLFFDRRVWGLVAVPSPARPNRAAYWEGRMEPWHLSHLLLPVTVVTLNYPIFVILLLLISFHHHLGSFRLSSYDSRWAMSGGNQPGAQMIRISRTMDTGSKQRNWSRYQSLVSSIVDAVWSSFVKDTASFVAFFSVLREKLDNKDIPSSMAVFLP